MPTGSGPTSPTSPTPQSTTNNIQNGADRKSSIDCGSKLSTSHDPTPYIQRARVTRPTPPKPSTNPMQFVQIKPCNLYQSAQEQLKRAEEVKKVKEIKKEEPEDWQCNLDNWKSSRRKRVEHIIDRVVEVKKLELEEHDRTRRKSKTFSEMLEERGTRRKLSTLPVYTEDESNDFSDLGIGTSSASGKSSLSEDYDNHSVMSDNVDNDKPSFDLDNNSNHEEGGASRDYISSPGYDTSSSTAPASSPDPCEYTYEGAIQDYKTRISKTQSTTYNTNGFRAPMSSGQYSKDSTPERNTNESFPPRRMSGNKIEDRLLNFEIKSANDNQNEGGSTVKKDLPKVDILKRRELFEKENAAPNDSVISQKRGSNDFSNSKSIKERLSSLEKKPNEDIKKSNRLSGDISSIKDRLQHLEKQNAATEKTPKIEVPVVPLKDRLSSLQTAAKKEETKKPVVLVDEHQLEMLKQEELAKQQQQQQVALKNEAAMITDDENLNSSHEILNIQDESNVDTDREDSGIHTTDVSCSVSQTDEQPELVNEESHHHHMNVDGLLHTQDIEPEYKNDDDLQPTFTPEKTDEQSVIIPDVVPLDSMPATPSPDDTVIEQPVIVESASIITSPEPQSNDLETSVNEALELALQAIDNESTESEVQIDVISAKKLPPKPTEPIYENMDNIEETRTAPQVTGKQKPMPPSPTIDVVSETEPEPYYQVPKSSEPYYEVPKHTKPIPVYENIEIFYPGTGNGSIGSNVMEPPKEKPPPPPVEDFTDDDEGATEENNYEEVSRKQSGQPIKRMNSTKRIKKELRNKRSSFLGIEDSNDDDSYLELTVAPPPDMAQLLKEEKRLEKQLYMKAGLYDSSDTGDSRDSGVSENHSRQSSEPFTNSSEEHEDLLVKKEKEIIEVLEKEEEKQRNAGNWKVNDESDAKIRVIEDQIREQEEVLRVERELLQLEQEELKRQRENLMLRENLARRELEHGAKMLMSANRRSLQDINNVSVTATTTTTAHYANIPNQIYQIETDYCKSMSDLQDFTPKRSLQQQPPIPPAKPMRSHIIVDSRQSSGLVKIASPSRMLHSQSIDELAPLRNYQPNSAVSHGNMSRHTLHALSATPKPKFTDGWIQSKNGTGSPEKTNGSSWLTYQEKRRSVPDGFNYNKHWLIQEAEQRRIDQQRGIRSSSITTSTTNGWGNTKSAIQRNGSTDNKPLPDSIIQTLTQRVQSKGIGERKSLSRLDATQNEPLSSATSLISVSTPQLNSMLPADVPTDKILSVSGKKKCSHCGEELGRGAAMIIESLRLFYHIDCFKCCVCHVQLSDGLNGTDVRVRNQKLHCHNCYSSDDGIKFSCV